MTDRAIIFIDWQNLFMAARRAFHPARAEQRSIDGQINPVALGEMICSRSPQSVVRALSEVRVYR